MLPVGYQMAWDKPHGSRRVASGRDTNVESSPAATVAENRA